MGVTTDRRASRRLAGVLLLGVVAFCGCGAGASAVQPTALDTSATPIPAPTAQPIGTAVPNVIGLTLDEAQSRVRSAGFGVLADDLLRDRSQDNARSWLVCTQDPSAGPVAPTSVVELGVVRTDETCPGAATSTSAAPTTTQAAVAKPKPKPAPRPAPAAAPRPTTTTAKAATKPSRSAEPAPSQRDSDSSSGSGAGSGSSVGTVNPGSFCDPPGTGVTKKGTPMVCGPGSDGRNRWKAA